MTDHPEVLVFGSINDRTLPAPFLALSRSFGRIVSDTLGEVGLRQRSVDTAEPLPEQAELHAMASAGLVLLGGGDVDPALYGHTDPVENLYGVHPEVDRAAIDLILHAVENEVPILAICRGAQLVNVALGGTLIPDIENWELHRGATADTIFIEEQVSLAPDSRLAGIAGATSLTVMNGHHQAIDALGTDVVATGYAQDGLVESIEVDRPGWIIGVQWHPEHEAADAGQRRKLFAAFEEAVRERRQ